MAKRITIDELSDRMENGFQTILKRLDTHAEMISGVAEDVTEIKGTLQDHSQRLDRIETKLDNTIERVDDHSVRLDRVEKAQER